MRMQMSGLNSRRIGGADDRANRRAGNRGGLDAEFVDGFENGDMGEAARAAAAQSDGERGMRLPLRGGSGGLNAPLRPSGREPFRR